MPSCQLNIAFLPIEVDLRAKLIVWLLGDAEDAVMDLLTEAGHWTVSIEPAAVSVHLVAHQDLRFHRNDHLLLLPGVRVAKVLRPADPLPEPNSFVLSLRPPDVRGKRTISRSALHVTLCTVNKNDDSTGAILMRANAENLTYREEHLKKQCSQ